jgi:hypothetical protein
LAESPGSGPWLPQWYGNQIWWMIRPSSRSGAIRSVISTVASIAGRAVIVCAPAE